MKTLEYSLKFLKKQKDQETIKNEKIEEEIFVTKKQIKSTKNLLVSLSNDLKKANYEENVLLKNPDHNNNRINNLNKNISYNKKKYRKSTGFN